METPTTLATARAAYRLILAANPEPGVCANPACRKPLRPGYRAIFKYIGQPERCPDCYDRANGLYPEQGEL